MRRIHQLIGYLLLAPLVVWSLSGLFFLFRPAYPEAYAPLPVVSQLSADPVAVEPGPDWLEYRLLETVLGQHLLVRRPSGWEHRSLLTGQTWPEPPAEQLRPLLLDAIAVDPQRYGETLQFRDGHWATSTGVQISLDWSRLSLSQSGQDTRWIDWVYDLHYLRWTGWRPLDNFAGAFGLLLLILMTVTGARLLWLSHGKRPAD